MGLSFYRLSDVLVGRPMITILKADFMQFVQTAEKTTRTKRRISHPKSQSSVVMALMFLLALC